MTHRIGPACAALLGLALTALPATAQRAAWDQDKVTELAVELSDVVRDLQREFRRQPGVDIFSGQARSRHRFADHLRVMRTETRALAAQLEDGAGFEETEPIAQRLATVIRDLRQEGRRMSWKEPVLGLAQRAEELIDQLRPFYVNAATGG